MIGQRAARRFRAVPHVATLCLLGTGLTVAACGGSSSPSRPTSVSATTPSVVEPPPAVPTAPPVAREVYLTGAGDIADCVRDGAGRTASLLDHLDGTIFTVGDNVYMSGTPDEFRRCYEPTWGRHKARTRPSPGNHDYVTPNAAGYFEYFGSAAGPPNGYYSYDLGAWHIISLNTNVPVDGGSAQMGWLRADLAANATKCTLAYFHHPLFSSGDNGGSSRQRDLWRVLHNAGVEVIVSAHDHTYERFARQDADGRPDAQRGIRQFIVGTGGTKLYGFPRVERNSEVRGAAWGVIRFALRADDYSWEFLPVGGQSFSDAGSDTCH